MVAKDATGARGAGTKGARTSATGTQERGVQGVWGMQRLSELQVEPPPLFIHSIAINIQRSPLPSQNVGSKSGNHNGDSKWATNNMYFLWITHRSNTKHKCKSKVHRVHI